MGQKITLVDDFDGVSDAETMTFVFRGQEFEVDLNEENTKKYKDLIEAFELEMEILADHGRPVVRQSAVRVPRGRDKEELNHIRNWARSKGHTVNTHGRIPEKIVEAYEKEQRDRANAQKSEETSVAAGE